MSRAYDRDPYAILGISPTATASQVKETYHRLARQYHPDVNKDPGAGERMKDINWAYDILSDPQERSFYDYWQSSNIRTEYYYPGTAPQDSTSSSSRTTSSPGNWTHSSYPGRTYSKVRVSQKSSAVGCSSFGIAWIIIIVITNLVRAIGPSLSARPGYNYSPELRATQTAQMEKFESAMNTFYASQSISTASGMGAPSPSSRSLVTASPVPRVPEAAEPVQGGWRSEYVPGSWEWDHINRYFPELTTPDGLSDEVTSITYDQLRGYRIRTRSSGEYWILVDRINRSLIPVHYTATSPPGQ